MLSLVVIVVVIDFCLSMHYKYTKLSAEEDKNFRSSSYV